MIFSFILSYSASTKVIKQAVIDNNMFFIIKVANKKYMLKLQQIHNQIICMYKSRC